MESTMGQRAPALFTRLACSVLLIALVIAAPSANAQLPTPLLQPNLNLLTSGNVYAIARLADGSAILGGEFVSVNGVLRSNIAKRLPDGTLDPGWHPLIDGVVLSLATDSAGNVYVGGLFNHADGHARRNLVKLSTSGIVVPDWNPSPDADVTAMVVNAAGEIFVGGWFQNIGGQVRSRLAKVSASSGVVDSQWNPAPAGSAILSLHFSPDGQLYIGGQFYGIGKFPNRKNVAKVSTSGVGAVDPVWDPSPSGYVTGIAVANDGFVFLAGAFVQGGYPTVQWFREHIAKFSGTGVGVLVEEWNPFNFQQSYTQYVAIDENGWVYLSGGLTYYSSPGFEPQAIRRASSDGSGAIDMSWEPGVNGDVYAISVSANTVYVGGFVVDVAGQARLGFAALDGDGNAGPPLDAESPPGGVSAMAKQPDGKLIVAGFFKKANGQLRRGLMRLNSDGSLDANWNPSSDGYVRAIAIGADGSIFVGGEFSWMGGQQLRGIAKLDSSTGAVDGAWNPGFRYATIYGLAFDSAGYVYVGGEFGDYANTSRNLVRIPASGNGAVDLSWLPAPHGAVESLSLDGNGALFVSGRFLDMDGQPRKRIAKLLTSGPTLLDPDWKPQAATQIYQVVADGNGSVYVAGGYFPIAGGGSTAAIAKLSTSGVGAADPLWRPFTDRFARRIAVDTANSSLYAFSTFYDPTTGIDSPYLSKHSTNGNGEADPSWNPTANDFVSTMQVDGDKLLLGGYFTQVSGQQRYGLAALPLIVPDVIHADGFDTSL